MIHFFLILSLLGSPKVMDSCDPKSFMGDQGVWDGRRFVRASYQEISVSDDGFFWQTVGPVPVDPRGNYAIDFQTNGSVYLWSHQEGSFASSDLVHWQALTIPRGYFLWTGNQWLVYSYEGYGVSSDGYTWEMGHTNVQLYSVVYYKDHYLSVGSPIKSSADGLTWVSGSINADSLTVFADKIVALKGNEVWISTDGLSWQGGPIAPASAQLTSVAYNGQVFVVTGPQLYTSSDGITWATQTMPNGIYHVHNVGSAFFTTGQIWKSVDGQNWENMGWTASRIISNGSNTTYLDSGYIREGKVYHYLEINAFEWVNGLYITSQANLNVSFDGIGWQPLPFNTEKVFYNEGRWECFDNQGLHYSSDGVTWTHESAPQLNNTVTLVHGRYFQQSSSSSDGMTWVDSGTYVSNIIWTGADYLAYSPQGYVRSTDGIVWTPSPYPSGMSLLGIVFKDGIMMGLSGNSVMVSLDQGHQWFQSLVGANAVGVFNDHFVVLGPNGRMNYSSDGITWKEQGIGISPTTIIVSAPELLIVGLRYNRYGIGCLNGETKTTLPLAVFPWVVANQTWYSRLGLMNQNEFAAHVLLEAEDRTGNKQTFTTLIPPNGLFTALASELFPGLNGYSVTVRSPSSGLYSTLTTYNEDPQAGSHSPAQAEASMIGDLSDAMLFAYLPGEGVPAIVIENMAPNATEVQVDFFLINEQGAEIAQVQHNLTGKRPFASTVSDLFPGVTLPISASVRAIGPEGAWLSGLTFDFNHLGQPAMDRAFNLHTP